MGAKDPAVPHRRRKAPVGRADGLSTEPQSRSEAGIARGVPATDRPTAPGIHPQIRLFAPAAYRGLEFGGLVRFSSSMDSVRVPARFRSPHTETDPWSQLHGEGPGDPLPSAGATAMTAAPVTVHFDGACRPPFGGGVATYGFIIEGVGIHHEGRGLARPPWDSESTNNVAEYTGALRALEWLHEDGFDGPVILCGDSQLVIRQMRGEYRVRSAHLQPYASRLGRMSRRFAKVDFVWVPREQNRQADLLSKIALEEAWAPALRNRPGTRR